MIYYVGLAMIIASWALNPLMGAMLDLEMAEHRSTMTVATIQDFLPLNEQINKLNGNFINQAHSILWLNGSLPSFTTSSAALKPFAAASENTPYPPGFSGLDKDVTIEAETMQYYTELDCQPATVADTAQCSALDGSPPFASMGPDCVVSKPEPFAKSGVFRYRGWYSSAWNLGLKDRACSCGEKYSNVFSAAVVVNDTLSPNKTRSVPPGTTWPGSTYLFCKTSYLQQPVKAKIWAWNGSVVSVDPHGQPESLPPQSFNTSLFDRLLGTIVSGLSETDTDLDGSFGTLNADINDAFIPAGESHAGYLYPDTEFDDDDDSRLSGWIFTRRVGPFSVYLDPDMLANTLEQAHRLLFSLALGKTFEPAHGDVHLRQATITRQPAAITVNATFTRLAQIALGALASLAILISILSYRRQMKLLKNPSTILRTLSLCGESFRSQVDQAESRSLQVENVIRDQRFKLVGKRKDNAAVKIERCLERRPSTSTEKTKEQADVGAHPQSMRIHVLVLVAALISSAIFSLDYLQRRMATHHGISSFSSSDFRRRLLLSYAPTALATLPESFWAMVLRDMCFLEPFKALFKGKAKARTSVSSRLTWAPPQFAIYEAIKTRNILLAFLCLILLSANILSVVMSGLFEPHSQPISYVVNFQKSLLPRLQNNQVLVDPEVDNSISGKSSYDYFYTLDQSLGSNGIYPPWTNDRFFFIPFDIDDQSLDRSQVEKLQVRTAGFGLSTSCSPEGITVGWNESSSRITVVGRPGINRTELNSTLSDGVAGQTFYADCPHDYYGQLRTQQTQQKRLAAECVRLGEGNNQSSQGLLFSCWFRTNPGQDEGVPIVQGYGGEPTVSGTFLACDAQLLVGTFDVVAEPGGKFISATQVGSLDSNITAFVTDESSIAQYATIPAKWLGLLSTNEYWHDTPFAGTWLNHFINSIKGSKDVVDPSKPLPDASTVGPLVEDIMRRFFAVYLSLTQQSFASAATDDERGEKATVLGTAVKTEERIFFAPRALVASLTLLGLNLLAVVAVLFNRPKRVLPRMPTNIMAIASYASHSQMMRDVAEDKTATGVIDSDPIVRYSYGSFVGTNGKARVGIERELAVSTGRGKDVTESVGRQAGSLRVLWRRR